MAVSGWQAIVQLMSNTEKAVRPISPSRRLTNKVAVVFGAGSVGAGWGNGKATAVAFAVKVQR